MRKKSTPSSSSAGSEDGDEKEGTTEAQRLNTRYNQLKTSKEQAIRALQKGQGDGTDNQELIDRAKQQLEEIQAQYKATLGPEQVRPQLDNAVRQCKTEAETK